MPSESDTTFYERHLTTIFVVLLVVCAALVAAQSLPKVQQLLTLSVLR